MRFMMQEKFVFAALAALLFGAGGCTNEFNLATQKEELILYSTAREVDIGQKVAASIEKHYKLLEDVDANARVERILDSIVKVCDRKDVVYFIKIIDDDLLNAVSLPGGYIYIFKGVLEKSHSDDELAGVIAHEVAHITAKHAIKRLQNAYGALLLQIASTQTNARVAGGLSFALTSLFMEHSKQAEFEADRLAVKYLKAAGYNPTGITTLLQTLKTEQDKEPLRQYTYWRTHPHIPQRIAVTNQEITGRLEFQDYLKLIEGE